MVSITHNLHNTKGCFDGIKETTTDTFLDDNTIYHHIDGVLFILFKFRNFGHIVDNSIDTDTDVTILLNLSIASYAALFSYE